jgi:MFS family permease
LGQLGKRGRTNASEPPEETAGPAPLDVTSGGADGGIGARPPIGSHGRVSIGQVFAIREARYLYAAYTLSLIGDQLAKVALAVLVYSRTHSPILTAVTYAISYLPWILGGPVLSSYADRWPRRTVLIASDLLRASLVAMLAIPGLPLPVLLGLLFLATMLAPSFESARSAIWPEILEGELYILGNAVVTTTYQIGQVLSFAIGGALVALISPRGVLGIDAATFATSGLLVAIGVLHRPVSANRERRSVWSETRAGLRLVFGSRRLRSIVLLVWGTAGSCFAWEGIVVPWSHELHSGAKGVGFMLAAAPVGTLLGSILLGRLVRPATRDRLMLPFALLAPLALVPIALIDQIGLALVPLALTGFLMAFNIPLNGIFVQAVPAEFRGRAFGIAQSGLQASQGIGVLIAGALADQWAPSTVITCFGIAGFLLVAAITTHAPLFRGGGEV